MTDGSQAATHGVVCAAGGGVYEVRLEGGRMVEAALRGRVKLEARAGDKVVAGDRVTLMRWRDAWVVESVEARTTAIVRRGRGGRRAKIVAANLDTALVVLATRDPTASYQLIDRLLVIAETSGMQSLLVVNKADLDPQRRIVGELTALYGGIGYPVLVTSTATGEGLGALRTELCRGAAALVGPSGVGKSSLLNAVDPALSLRTGELSGRTRKGRHTTVGVRLVALACGGLVADTPGFGDVGLWDVAPDIVERCFPELEGPRNECRFAGCAHLKDAGCAVRAAVERGEVAESRYRSYVALREESESQNHGMP